MGTYPDPERGECLACDQHCDRDVGCAGPLPILDQQNGCLDCDLVQLTATGVQVSREKISTAFFLLAVESLSYLLILFFTQGPVKGNLSIGDKN